MLQIIGTISFTDEDRKAAAEGGWIHSAFRRDNVLRGPLDVIEQEDGRTAVKVHQLVKSLGGDVLSDSEVWQTGPSSLEELLWRPLCKHLGQGFGDPAGV